MKEPLIQHVSDTAFMVATYRALEGKRPDALFQDPLAEKLAGEHGQKIAKSLSGGIFSGMATKIRNHAMVWNMAIRTRVIDDYIREAIAQGADAVLNLGAGLDTRPYRLDVPASFHWIEVDYPKMIELKETRLKDEKPRCQLERVKLDLTKTQDRQKLFSQINGRFKKVFVLTEGVVPYLSVEEAAALADDLKAQSSFKFWVVDYFSDLTMKYRAKFQKRAMKNAPFRFNPANYFEFFKEHGWQAKETRYLWDEAQKLNRPMPIPFMAKFFFVLRSPFMSKEKKKTLRESLKKFVAYVLFEPQ